MCILKGHWPAAVFFFSGELAKQKKTKIKKQSKTKYH